MLTTENSSSPSNMGTKSFSTVTSLTSAAVISKIMGPNSSVSSRSICETTSIFSMISLSMPASKLSPLLLSLSFLSSSFALSLSLSFSSSLSLSSSSLMTSSGSSGSSGSSTTTSSSSLSLSLLSPVTDFTASESLSLLPQPVSNPTVRSNALIASNHFFIFASPFYGITLKKHQ